MLQDRIAGTTGYSLPEVHNSVLTSHPKFWKRILAFAGPAYLVSVGYMDPGNWATDLEGGARFGYQLLWVLVMSNVMALLLQTLSARLGIVTRRDLAQACRDEYPKAVSVVLWILCELAVIACDLAEVLGAAIGLNLLFHLPLIVGVIITSADTLLVLGLSRLGIRTIEAFVLVLIGTIAACFAFEIFFAHPQAAEVVNGLLPRLSGQSLYVAVAIIGATVMPHNLYLHSALVQTRRIGETVAEKREACRFNLWDSMIALNGALFVNAAILILAGAVFFKRGVVVTEIQQAHQLLTPMLGTTAASLLFGLALLCSGQSSTLTGTMAGQIVMEGFLRFKMQPWLRRLVTRFLAITPAALTIYLAGEAGTYKLLIFSQVILNLQLPFAVIPLIHLTSDRQRMGPFTNGRLVRVMAWVFAAVILLLDIWLVATQLTAWISHSREPAIPITVSIVLAVAFLTLLAYIAGWPLLRRRVPLTTPVAVDVAQPSTAAIPEVRYSKILVPLDHSHSDAQAVANAVVLGRMHQSQILLLHVEEGVISQLFGAQSSTAEVEEGHAYLEGIASSLRAEGIAVHVEVRHGRSPVDQITRAVKEFQPDLIIMAGHGHRGLKDLIFGTTISSVRHRIRVPLLIVTSH